MLRRLPIGSSFVVSPNRLEFELAPEARVGVWRALGERIRVELDLEWGLWSETNNAVLRLSPGCSDAPNCTDRRLREWDDTIALRAAVEWQASSRWRLFSGLAFEESPVEPRRVEPGVPRGDAAAFGLGASYSTEAWGFDVGAVRSDFDDLDVAGEGNLRSEMTRLSASLRLRL